MKSFYTNVQVYGSRILYRGVEDGRKVKRRIDYYPTLFVPSKTQTEFASVSGDAMAEMKPGNIRDARDFVGEWFARLASQAAITKVGNDHLGGLILWGYPYSTVAFAQ